MQLELSFMRTDRVNVDDKYVLVVQLKRVPPFLTLPLFSG